MNRASAKIQEKILLKYSATEIKAATDRLCRSGCTRWERCHLLPITSTGEDCPYVQREGA